MDKITGESKITIQVARPIVYDYLADFMHHPQWVKNVFKLIPLEKGNIGVGAKFRTLEFTPPTSLGRTLAATLQYTLGVFKGVAPMSICEITALEPLQRIAWVGYLTQGRNGMFNRAEWELLIEAQGDNTCVTQRFCYLPQNARARKMLASLGDGKGIAESCLVSLEKLKQVLEHQAATKPTPKTLMA